MQIDLNADLGEGFGPWSMGDDAAMLDVVTSASIACGGHAGPSKSSHRHPMSESCRPRVIWEIVTARISAPPLNTLVTHSGMPSMVSPVMPVARK